MHGETVEGGTRPPGALCPCEEHVRSMGRPSGVLWPSDARSTDKACPEVTLHLCLRCGIVVKIPQHIVVKIEVTT